MEVQDLVDLLLESFPQFSPDVIRSVLEENDCRLTPTEHALEAMSSRQGTSGASTSSGQGGTGRSYGARDDQIRRDAMLARQMQAQSLSGGPHRQDSDGGDAWAETLNAVSSSLEENMRTAVTYASAFGGWASSMIANLDPTTLLFEDDEDYDFPGRPPPDTSKDKEGVSVGRSPLARRARNQQPAPAPRSRHSDEEEEEDEEGVDEGDVGANIASWLGGDDDVSYVKKDK